MDFMQHMIILETQYSFINSFWHLWKIKNLLGNKFNVIGFFTIICLQMNASSFKIQRLRVAR